jgi:uncharacterized DUF497 family protein
VLQCYTRVQMKVTYNYRNLARHKVSPMEVDQVADEDTTIECLVPPSNRGNERLMLVGFTKNYRLLEIGVEFFYYEDRMHIFHANDANKHYQQEYRKQIKQ